MKTMDNILKESCRSIRGPVIKGSQEYKVFHTWSFESSNALRR